MYKLDLNNFDLSQLPSAEDDSFEFKSSLVKIPELNEKLSKAVSAFGNSGGGYFVIGVDSAGNADGGIPIKVGKQDPCDWVDQIIHKVEPVPKYELKLIQDPSGRGTILLNNAVLLVLIHGSHICPHMAPDNRYYIRAGAHTVQAKHFIVEAIWAKRNFSKPHLTHKFCLNPEKPSIIQIGILALTDDPAIEVEITISPVPKLMGNASDCFPLKLKFLDRLNSFFFDVTTYSKAEEHFGENLILKLKYLDLSGNIYNYTTPLHLSGSLPPISFSHEDNLEKIVKVLEKIEKTISDLKPSPKLFP